MDAHLGHGSSFMENHSQQHPEGFIKFQTYLHESKGSQEQLGWAKRMTQWLIGLVDLYKRRYGGKIETTAGNNRELRAAIEASMGKTPEEAMGISFKFQETRKEMLFPPEFGTEHLLEAYSRLDSEDLPEYSHLFGKEQQLIANLTPEQKKLYAKLHKQMVEPHRIAEKLGIPIPADRRKWHKDKNYRILEARWAFRKPIDAEGTEEKDRVTKKMSDLAEFFRKVKEADGNVEQLPDELQLKRFNIDYLRGIPIALVHAHRRMGEPLADLYARMAKARGWPSMETLLARYHDPASVMQAAWDFFPRDEKTYDIEEFLAKKAKMNKAEIEALKTGEIKPDSLKGIDKETEKARIRKLAALPPNERLKKIQDALEQSRLDAIWREATLHGTKNIYDILMGIVIPMAGSPLHINHHEIKPFDGFVGLHEIFPPHERERILALEQAGKHQEVFRELRKHQELSVDESTQFTIEAALYHAARNFAKHDLNEAQGFEPRRIVELSRPYAEVNLGYNTPEGWVAGLNTFGPKVGLGPSQMQQVWNMIMHSFPRQWAAQNVPGSEAHSGHADVRSEPSTPAHPNPTSSAHAVNDEIGSY